MSDAASRPAFDAVRQRRSWSKVTDAAPTRAEVLTLVSAAGRVADHSSLRPWRIIELRGDDRRVLGAAIAKAEGDSTPSSKPLRAPLLIAVVASYRKSDKVPRWEQAAELASDASPLSPPRLVAELRAAMPDDALLFVDTGNASLWAGHYFEARRPGTYLIDMGLAAMGVGNIFGNFVAGALRNPSAAAGQFTNAIVGAALAEGLGIFALVVALVLLFVA